MSRRPYIETEIIKDDLRPHSATNDGYSRFCHKYEPVGMDGRCDWFRWQCRDCDKTHISMRSEHHQRYLRCRECDTLHHVSNGFFSPTKETRPLRPDEVDGELFHATGDDFEAYGSAEYIKEMADESDYFDVERVWKVTGNGEVLAQKGELSA